MPATAPAPVAFFDFMGGVLPSGATLARASVGWAFNAAGVLTSFAVNAARFAYSPTTLALLGLYNEPAVTNVNRNSSMTGAVAGTPGTAPTNWSLPSTADNVTRTIVGTGVEDGIPYIDVRYFGTPTVGQGKVVSFDSSTNPSAPAAVGQTWTGALFIRLLAGTLPIPNNNRVITAERSAAGGNNGGGNSPNINPTNAPLRTQGIVCVDLFTNATTAFALLQLSLGTVAGQPCDFTVRLGAPQLAMTPVFSSPILTTAAAVTRAADVVTLTMVNGTYDITVKRASGSTTYANQVVTTGSWVVPTDLSPVQSVSVVMDPTTIDFTGGTLPAGTTLTRASVGWALDAAGVLTSYAINVARFAHDATTLATMGLLNEAAGTNAMLNSVASGAVAGSPGTQPTNWNVGGSNDTWIRTLSNPVVEDGYSGVDLRYSGTPTNGSTKGIQFVPNNTSIPALQGQTWQFAVNVRLMAGSLAGCKIQIAFTERDASGAAINGTGNVTVFVPTTAALRTQRFTVVDIVTSPLTRFINPFIQLIPPGPGIPADVTLRFAQPQVVMLPGSSSIVTLGAATVTRAQDVLTIPAFAGLYTITIERLSGTQVLKNVTVPAGGYVVPNDPSPLRKVTLASAPMYAGKATPVVIMAGGTPVFAGPTTPRVMVTGVPVLPGPATPIQIVTGRPTYTGPATPMTVVTGRPVYTVKATPVA